MKRRMMVTFWILAGMFWGLPLFADCPDPDATYTITPPTFDPHVGFEVSGTASASPSPKLCFESSNWVLVDKGGETEITIDSVGGLIVWTPGTPGPVTITIGVCKNSVADCNWKSQPENLLATAELTYDVSPNSVTYPSSSAYIDEMSVVEITGTAYDDNLNDSEAFVGYTLEWKTVGAFSEWAFVDPDQDDPVLGKGWYSTPVDGTASDTLAVWDIAGIPDGTQIDIRLTVRYDENGTDVFDYLNNEVIIDRTAASGWPKFHGPTARSAAAADLDLDGSAEIIFAGYQATDGLVVWDNQGTTSRQLPVITGSRAGVAVGNVLGDGRPEIVWPAGTASTDLLIVSYDTGEDTLVIEQSVEVPTTSSGDVAKAVPLLVNLDTDDYYEVVLTTMDGRVFTYDPGSDALVLIYDAPSGVCHAPSAADFDGDSMVEIVFSTMTRAYALTYQSGGRSGGQWVPFPGWTTTGRGGTQDGIGLAVENVAKVALPTGACGSGLAKPAIGDIDGDGVLEVVIGPNVIDENGVVEAVPPFVLASADGGISATIADLDGDGTNGLEVIVGNVAWHGRATIDPGLYDINPLDFLAGESYMGPAIVGETSFHSRPVLTVISGGIGVTGIRGFSLRSEMEAPKFPKVLFGETSYAIVPVLGDFDGDGHADLLAPVVSQKYGAIIGKWIIPGIADPPYRPERNQWEMYGHDLLRSGRYTLPRPNRPVLTGVEWGFFGADPHPSLNVYWEDQSNVETGYRVEIASTADPYDFQPFFSTGPDIESIGAAISSGDYRIRVRAWRYDTVFNEEIWSDPSETVVLTVP